MELNLQNFDETVAAKPLVLVDFWATWCGPCRMLAGELEALAADHPELLIGKVNVDEQPDLANRFHIDAIPAVYLFRDGKAVATAVGYRTKPELEAALGL